MEQEGYDVTYATNIDTHADPDHLRRARTFLSVGHDEYWSLEMYQNVKRAIDSGVNAAFLCGNSVDGMTPLEPSAQGVPHRTLSRVGLFGPKDDRFFENWPEMRLLPVIGPSDALLMGVGNVAPVTGGGDWICAMEDHWMFEGTGMKNGDAIPGLVGWEFHGGPADLPQMQVVATGKTRNGSNQEGTYASVFFPGPRHNLIFNAATIWWADGLSEPPGYVRPSAYTTPQGPDRRVQEITRNLFDVFRVYGGP